MQQASKKCSRCREVRLLTQYCKRNSTKDGLNYECNVCVSARNRAWREKNPDQLRENNARWYQANKHRTRELDSQWRARNPDRARELSAERWKRWVEANKDAYRAANRAKMATPERRMARSLWGVLRGRKQGRRWCELLGYDGDELRAHLERQFLKGMTWENYGKWHIDHIVPLAAFTITGPDCPELKRAWALTNLRPLWAVDNMRKNARRETLL